MAKINTRTIVITPKESIISSMIKDTYSMSWLGFLFYFNYNFIGGSYVVNFLILTGIILYIKKVISVASHPVSKVKYEKIKKIINN